MYIIPKRKESMKPKLMSVNRAVFLAVACSLIGAVAGAAGGAEYVLRGMDVIEKSAAADRASYDQHQAAAEHAIVASLSDNLGECEEKFSASTLIYETAPQLNLSITGVRGLPIIPVGVQGNSAPRWWIPAKITPQTYGDPRGAVYFYTRRDPHYKDGRLLTEGPFVPGVVNQGQ